MASVGVTVGRAGSTVDARYAAFPRARFPANLHHPRAARRGSYPPPAPLPSSPTLNPPPSPTYFSQDDARRDVGFDGPGGPGGPWGGAHDRRYDQGPPGGYGGPGPGPGGPPRGAWDRPPAGGMSHRPSMMGGGGHNRPSLLASAPRRPQMQQPMGAASRAPPPPDRRRPPFPVDRDRDEGEIGETPAAPPPQMQMRGAWGAGRDMRNQRDVGRGGGGYPPEEDGELPTPGAAPLASRDVRDTFNAEPTPVMEPYGGGGLASGGLSRAASAPVPGDAADPESPAPKRKKLGWGQGLARSKSTGAPDAVPAPAGEVEPSARDAGRDGMVSEANRAESNRTPPLSSAVDRRGSGAVSASADDSKVAEEMAGSSARGTPSAPAARPLDPVARAAAAAAAKAEAEARRELLSGIEKTKAGILEEMETTDAAIANLEREIAESEDKGENDREQVEEQRTHQKLRLNRELDGVKSNLERAEKAAKRADAAAEAAEAEAEEMKRKAGLEASGKAAPMDAVAQAAAKKAAAAVQIMLAGREPRRALVRRVLDRNKTLAGRSRDGIKTTCGLPLSNEVTRVTVEEMAARNAAAEADSSRDVVKDAVKATLRARRAAVAEKELTLAVTYLQRRARWVDRARRADRARLEKEMGSRPGGKLPTPGSRASSRHRSSGFGGAVRSDYEESQVIQELQAKERLKTLVKLPPMVLDPEERRVAVFRSRNALVEDPKGEAEAAKLVRPWMDWEKKIFHEKFSSYGKNFKRIATFIDGRTTADCVVYYYQTQKTGDGFKGRRKAQAKKRRAYAEARRMTGGAWNGPQSTATSVAAQAKAAKEREAELRAAERIGKNRSAEARQERAALAAAEKKRKAEAKAKAEKKEKEKEKEKDKSSKRDDASGDEDDDSEAPTTAGKKKGKDMSRSASKEALEGTAAAPTGGGWTPKEKSRFLAALAEHGKDWKSVAAAVSTKSQNAVRGYFSKQKVKLGLEKIVEEHAKKKGAVGAKKPAEKVADAGGGGRHARRRGGGGGGDAAARRGVPAGGGERDGKPFHADDPRGDDVGAGTDGAPAATAAAAQLVANAQQPAVQQALAQMMQTHAAGMLGLMGADPSALAAAAATAAGVGVGVGATPDPNAAPSFHAPGAAAAAVAAAAGAAAAGAAAAGAAAVGAAAVGANGPETLAAAAPAAADANPPVAGTKRKAEEDAAEGTDAKSAKTGAELPKASLRWGEGVEEKEKK